MKWRTKITAALCSIGVLVGVGVVTAPAAQATYNYAITYVADCPGLAEYQQLVIRPFAPGAHAHVYSYNSLSYNDGPGWTMDVPQTSSGIYYNPVQYRDVMRYVMYVDTKNFYYHVSCYYY